MKNVLMGIVFSTLVLTSAIADTVTGKITFVKKPPYAGALYVKESATGVSAATLDQSNKVFNQKIFAVSNGGKIQFKNSDEFQHNIFANDPNSGVQFDVGLMNPGANLDLDVKWQENSLTRIGCKIHPKMRSYILNVPTKVFQLFEFEKKVKEYDVSLANVQASHNTFVLSLPKYEEIEVTLNPGDEKTVDILRKGKVRGSLTLKRP